ncbi:hypothetical protein EVAR_66841_1 [Eumeta japonica]|uniref:Uncharacterized protein n=1 Tax=Eumeta variegata TaxID=151549 RepID=A0A4C1ZBJ5_EUMVA|nr:hypothetical protein EVAR_66841_1 [Eumeta japonica]
MWRRVAMRKRLCDSLPTRFDGAVYYGIHFDYIYTIVWRGDRRHGTHRHANNPVYPTPIDVSHQIYLFFTMGKQILPIDNKYLLIQGAGPDVARLGAFDASEFSDSAFPIARAG